MMSEIADGSVSPASSEPPAQPPSDGLKLDLNFIRDEILRMMVTGIATAKAETLGELATSHQATNRVIAKTSAGSHLAAAQLACAIVAALAERGVLDTADVIRWAEWMADHQAEGIDPTISESAVRTLRSFAKILTSMALPRPSRHN
jgi:hypothetical protein